mgnify:CR=1 FL=1
MRVKTYREAIIEAMMLEMRRDEKVFVIGEDISGGRGCGDFEGEACLLYTSPSPRDATLSRMPSSA